MPLLRFLAFLAILVIHSLTAQAASPNHALLEAGGAGGWLNVMRPLTAADMEGRLVLLDFWTYGCINCMHIVPDLTYLEEIFGDRLLVIGVHSAKFKGEQEKHRILAAAKRLGLKHPVINDYDFSIWKAFDVGAWPTQVLLGPDGQEIARYVGEGHRAEMEKDIAQAAASVTNTESLAKWLDTRQAGSPTLSFPAGLEYAPDLNVFFVADAGHNRVLAFNDTGKILMTIGSGAAGLADGDFATAQFRNPRGLAYKDGILYIADTDNHALRRADLNTKTVETLAGTGTRGYERQADKKPGKGTAIASPWALEFLHDGKTLAIAMAGTHQLWSYDTMEGTLSVLAGSGAEGIDDGTAAQATLAQPSGLARVGKMLYFVDAESSALRVLKPASKFFKSGGNKVETLIGVGLFDYGHMDGYYPEARLQHPQGIYADERRILIADTYNNVIRMYDFKSEMLWTVTLPGQALDEPGDILVVGDDAYITDTNSHRIIKLNTDTSAITPLPLTR